MKQDAKQPSIGRTAPDRELSHHMSITGRLRNPGSPELPAALTQNVAPVLIGTCRFLQDMVLCPLSHLHTPLLFLLPHLIILCSFLTTLHLLMGNFNSVMAFALWCWLSPHWYSWWMNKSGCFFGDLGLWWANVGYCVCVCVCVCVCMACLSQNKDRRMY